MLLLARSVLGSPVHLPRRRLEILGGVTRTQISTDPRDGWSSQRKAPASRARDRYRRTRRLCRLGERRCAATRARTAVWPDAPIRKTAGSSGVPRESCKSLKSMHNAVRTSGLSNRSGCGQGCSTSQERAHQATVVERRPPRSQGYGPQRAARENCKIPQTNRGRNAA